MVAHRQLFSKVSPQRILIAESGNIPRLRFLVILKRSFENGQERPYKISTPPYGARKSSSSSTLWSCPLRRFNYASYVTPNDPKRQRTELYGKFRTEATNPHDVAAEFLADLHDATLLNVDGKIDSKVLPKNKLSFTFTFIEPYPSSVLVEMQEVVEGTLHPLTQEGFLAWAEDRVKAEPVVDGKPNSVELELAGVLHQLEVDELQGESSGDLRAWLADIFWSGRQGYAEMSRDELLDRLQSDFIDQVVESFETIEDALE